jgi:hypothetical protein
VYERLPFTQRRELHRAVAEWIEERYAADGLEPFFPVLATHWKRASFEGEALRYLEACALLALRHYANHEAVGFLNEVRGGGWRGEGGRGRERERRREIAGNGSQNGQSAGTPERTVSMHALNGQSAYTR